MIAAGARGYMTAAAVNLVMSAQEEPETLAAVLGATLAVPDGQPLVWALHALGHARATRVYGPDLMAKLLRAGGTHRHPHLPVRGSLARGAGPAGKAPARALPRPSDRRRAIAAVPSAHARRGAADDRRDRLLRRRGGVGRHRPAQAGEVDAPHASPPVRPAAGRGGGRVRLPRRPRLPGAALDAALAGSSGPIASRVSHGACGGATPATTPAS